jgi:hypothetical protein
MILVTSQQLSVYTAAIWELSEVTREAVPSHPAHRALRVKIRLRLQ